LPVVGKFSSVNFSFNSATFNFLTSLSSIFRACGLRGG
jgi:hypothetical protein